MMSSKPSLRVEVPLTADLPDLGDKVDITISGKVVQSSREIQRYNDNKKVAYLEMEYDRKDVKVSGADPDTVDMRL